MMTKTTESIYRGLPMTKLNRERYRRILNLRDHGELTFAEIASLELISTERARQIYYKAGRMRANGKLDD